MICPVRTCKIEIDDDSRYCDQCGAEILICSKCGTPGTGKFCQKDGNRLESRKRNTKPVTPAQVEVSEAITPAPTSQQVEESYHNLPGDGLASQSLQQNTSGATVNFNFSPNLADSKLIIVHASGLELHIRDMDILGRNEGPHAQSLINFKFLSRKHAEILHKSGSWFIRDLGSTNKSRVNGAVLEPGIDYTIAKNDKLMLADQEFIVK